MKQEGSSRFFPTLQSVSASTKLWLAVAGLAVAFLGPLAGLIRLAAHDALYSYVLLIPGVSFFLVWQQRNYVRAGGKYIRGTAWFPLAGGTALLGWYASSRIGGESWATQDWLALTISAWLLFVGAACLRFLNTVALRALAFPLGFLVFMVPLPLAVEANLEAFLQYGSALAARLFFKLSGTPYVYENLTFHLPAFNMHVAPECSGIHSSIVLFLTSAVASHLFLRSPWKQAVFVLFVIPLGLLRNGFRVFVIGELCVRIGPEMSDSWIHRRGGPLFFLLSLVPLFLLLYFLVRTERHTPAPNNSPKPSP